MTVSPLHQVRLMAMKGRIIEPTTVQAEISDVLIGKTAAEIIDILTQLRRESIDPILRHELASQSGQLGGPYPVGCCGHIRDRIFAIIPTWLPKRRLEVSGAPPIEMRLRKAWCIATQGPNYFQNTIQAGNWIIDTAVDTIEGNRYPVAIRRIEESGLRNPIDHVDMCQTIESYWGIQCFPNLHLPEIAPLFPVTCVDKKGRVGFLVNNMRRVDAQNTLDGLRSARRFIFDSPFSHKRLPDSSMRRLHDLHGDDRSLSEEVGFRTKPSLGQVESSFSYLSGRTPSERAKIFLAYLDFLKGSPLDLQPIRD